jgi:hypothetical protein
MNVGIETISEIKGYAIKYIKKYVKKISTQSGGNKLDDIKNALSQLNLKLTNSDAKITTFEKKKRRRKNFNTY